MPECKAISEGPNLSNAFLLVVRQEGWVLELEVSQKTTAGHNPCEGCCYPEKEVLIEVAALKKLLAGPPHFLGVVASTKVLLLGASTILVGRGAFLCGLRAACGLYTCST